MLFVFLCGGKGTRFAHVTPHVKPTMNVLGRPMYTWDLDSLVAALDSSSRYDNITATAQKMADALKNADGTRLAPDGNEARDSSFDEKRLPSLLVVTNDDQRSMSVHRSIRKSYAPWFREVDKFALPFPTSGPAETTFLALFHDAHKPANGDVPFPAQPRPVWIVDNDVIHDIDTDFSFRETTWFADGGGQSDHFNVSRTVKIVVVDTTSPDCVLRHVDGQENNAEGTSPYAHVQLSDDRRRVVAIHEKMERAQAAQCPLVVMGAYGFGSQDLYLELYRKCVATYRDECVMMSDVVRTAIRENVSVVPVITSTSFTIGTPSQLEGALRRCPSQFSSRHRRLLRWVFDLDETLVTLPEVPGDYSTCQPHWPQIRLLRRLYAEGHTIVIFTARHMVTCNGDVAEVVRRVGEQTRTSLAALGVPYHELLFGKPHGDVYVDDKAVNPGSWVSDAWTHADLGYGYEDEVHPRWQSLCHNVSACPYTNTCVKIAAQPDQLRGYAHYLAHAPSVAKALAPRFYGISDDGSIHMELIDGTPIGKLNAWGMMGPRLFSDVLAILRALHGVSPPACASGSAADDEDAFRTRNKERLMSMYMKKLESRMSAHAGFYAYFFADDAGLLDDILQRLHAFFDDVYEPWPRECIHGDFWLGNVLRQHNDGALRMIDMRGAVGGAPGDECLTHAGDGVYDFAKLYQSLRGFDRCVYAVSAFSDETSEAENDDTESHVFTSMLATHIARETREKVCLRDVAHVSLCLVVGCLPFHQEAIAQRLGSWKRLVRRLRDDVVQEKQDDAPHEKNHKTRSTRQDSWTVPSTISQKFDGI